MDLFTPEFKRLKARRPLPDFSDVVDINNIDTQKTQHEIEYIKLDKTDVKPICGFKPCDEWNVFRFPKYPGFIVIQNPFYDGYQRYWVSRCLQDFSADRRNSTNLTNLGQFNYYDVWEDFVSRQCSTFEKDDPLRKLRWCTLGYHYGWDVKEYSENHKAEFPADVQCLSQYFSHCLGFGPFMSEAGIVNYYHLDSTLGGHTDHSEIDHTAPLFSFSFGQTCVFLLGGPTKETKPMAIYLHSGDVCVMSKEARLAYHAVPKILTPKENRLSSCFSTRNDVSHTNNRDLQEKKNSDNSFNDKQTTEKILQSECERKDERNIGSNSQTQGHDADTDLSPDNKSEYCSHSSHTDINTSDLIPIGSCNSCGGTQSYPISEEYVSHIDTLNQDIERVVSNLDWRPFETFLQGSRINMNLRQVLPPKYKTVEPKMEKYVLK